MTVSAESNFKALLYVAWEITQRCNAKCLHCYSNSGPQVSCQQDLSTEEALSVIDQLAEAGLMVLAFSGGEPMLRKDWPVLVKHAVKRGLSVNIASNGSCITVQTADLLQQLGVRSVTISLDSHKREIHDYFRQCPGLYKKAIRAITFLAERGIRTVISFTPTKLNWKDGLGVIELAKRLGADAVNLSEYVPAGRGSIALALSPPELRESLAQWIDLRESYKESLDLIWHDCRVGMLVPEDEKRHYVGCGAGKLVARICPDGTVTPCVFLPTPVGNLRHNSFSEIWQNSPLLAKFRERSEITGNCGSCEHLKTCGGCRAVAFAYSGGNPFSGDPHCWIQLETNSQIKALPDGEGLPV